MRTFEFTFNLKRLGLILSVCLGLSGCGEGSSDAGSSITSGNEENLPSTISNSASETTPSASKTEFTYHRDIAPILEDNCVECHRPGQSGPFLLMTFEQVRRRGKQIVEVTQSGFMPPWLPAKTAHPLQGARSLSETQKSILKSWVAGGSPEGSPTTETVTRNWPEGWQIREPDLVIEMEEAFEVPADGGDVYRNFVIPIPVMDSKYVRGMEFQPGNYTVAHHALLRVDTSGESYQMDQNTPGYGFDGMDTPTGARAPYGYFHSWNPGKSAALEPEGVAWQLDPGSDLVLQLHLQPSGKKELIKSRIGFYFTDEPPTRKPFLICLRSVDIDIPAGAKDYRVENNYILPVDVELIGILPHAHYLATSMLAWIQRPESKPEPILEIPEWDFNWQGEYRFETPLQLTAGTALGQVFVYDNSENNIRNPNHPPQRVTYGLESSDEMGELWFQVIPKNDQDWDQLRNHFERKRLYRHIAYQKKLLEADPNRLEAALELGKSMMILKRYSQAKESLETALKIDPKSTDAMFYLGSMYLEARDIKSAEPLFEEVLKLAPDHYKSHNYMGMISMARGNVEEAKKWFSQALEIYPNDSVARANLKWAESVEVPEKQ